jgi:hypothetical protein
MIMRNKEMKIIHSRKLKKTKLEEATVNNKEKQVDKVGKISVTI